jgi:hypothetical protein
LSVKENGSGTPGAMNGSRSAAGARIVSAAVSMRSNHLRLEHELQTVVHGAKSRRDDSERSR